MASHEHMYGVRHRAVYKARGKAAEYMCEQCCCKQAQEWSHTHDSDPDEVENYRPLCIRCHQKYDGVDHAANATGNRNAANMSEEGRAKLGLLVAERNRRLKKGASWTIKDGKRVWKINGQA